MTALTENVRPNSAIVSTYLNSLEVFKGNISVTSIHRHQDLCFNSSHREILYAIELCFNTLNKDKEGSFIKNAHFKENNLGKAVVISFSDVPSNSPFENILKHYKKYYLERIWLLDSHFGLNMKCFTKGIPAQEMEKILTKYKPQILHLSRNYSQMIYMQLPMDIIRYIYETFLVYKYADYNSVREQYESARKYIPKAGDYY